MTGKKTDMVQKSQNIHKGHRQRMKNVYRANGLDTFAEHEVLEFLLFYGIPYVDTNPIAHDLINRFGSLRNVFASKISELTEISGVGESAAVFIKLLGNIGIASVSEQKTDVRVPCGSSFLDFALKNYYSSTENYVLLIVMNQNREILGIRRFNGSITSSAISLRSIVSEAIMAHATLAVTVINRCGGIAFPSSEEISMAEELSDMFSMTGILFDDAVLLASGSAYSLFRGGDAV